MDSLVIVFHYLIIQRYKTGEIINAHDTRILNGCLSPDNLTLATVAGDENLKFWSLFDLYKITNAIIVIYVMAKIVIINIMIMMIVMLMD